MKTHCLFCNSPKNTPSYIPDTEFNGKVFSYKRCENCKLIFIDPIQTDDDLVKLYPTSYQDGLNDLILENPYQKLIGLRFSYGYQFDLLKDEKFEGTILDFGCGNANFIVNAKHFGFDCAGVEYNKDHVNILKKAIPSSKFYTVDEFLNSDQQFDLIRLSNVLEHFTDPKAMTKKLYDSLKPGGHLLVEGPVETNFNLAKMVREYYFELKKVIRINYRAAHHPTHVIFTNRKNQLQFFKSFSLHTVHYKISEAEWPFPISVKSAKGIVSKINAIIAKISMQLSKLNSNWGNTFIYLGKK